MSNSKKPFRRSEAWPPNNAFKYVQSDEFADLVSEAALASDVLPEGIAVVFDHFDRRARANSNLFQSFPTKGHLRKYLRRALFREAIRAKGQSRREPAQAADLGHLIAAKDVSPAHQAEQDEFVRAAHNALLRLKPEEHHVILLRLFVGRSNKEIARDLGISQPQASRLYYRGLARLLDMLGEFADH